MRGIVIHSQSANDGAGRQGETQAQNNQSRIIMKKVGTGLLGLAALWTTAGFFLLVRPYP
jgi:hypothetical protein